MGKEDLISKIYLELSDATYIEDQFDFVGMNCAMRPAKSAIF